MRIGIDARMMTPRATRGIGRYVEELIRALLEIAPEHEYVLVTRHPIHPFGTHPSVQTVVADVPWYGIHEQISMPALFRGLHADVIHIPHWNVPVFTSGPFVVTIHDLLLRHIPRSARVSTRSAFIAMIKRVGYRVVLEMAVRRAKRILVPTQFTSDDVAHFYPKNADKILVTGEGMMRSVRPVAYDYGKPPRTQFLLYVGSAYPHKGLDFLIDAWEEIEMRNPTLELKIAGEEDVFMQRVKHDAQKRGLTRVEFLGFVSDEKLATLYHEAVAFVFPSQFEGFGLPPLEAMQAGCPVIVSRSAALPEVLGEDGVFYFQPGSKIDILRAIDRVLRNPGEARQRVEKALPALSVRHDWKKTAEQTLQAYIDAMS
ncbi:MAG: glycosyltransferase family 4 protein [bacterium]|nr:glycosyltransferase family 4 protein [bacterium]